MLLTINEENQNKFKYENIMFYIAFILNNVFKFTTKLLNA